MKKTFLIISMLLASLTAQAEVVTVGQYNTGNCYPFSCFATDNGSQFQQVYAASAFSGASMINSISFHRSSGGAMDGASYTLRLSTTNTGVGALSMDPANNLGADVRTFGTFTVGGAMPDVLTFTGMPFHYNPAMGNLLLDVAVIDQTASNRYMSFFQADQFMNTTSRLWVSDGNVASGGSGLVTTFDTSEATAEVPEPGSMLLLGLGLAGLAAAGRKRKSA